MSRAALLTVVAALALSACAGTMVDVHFWDPDAVVLPLLKQEVEAPAAPQLNQYVVLLPNEDGTTGAVDVSDGKDTASLTEAYQAVRFDNLTETYTAEPPELSGQPKPPEEDGGFSAALIHEPQPPTSISVYFQLASTELTPESVAAMPAILSEIGSRPAPQIWLTGHTDRSGSRESNARTSRARAEAVRNLLDQAGVAAGAIDVQWHGEDRPAVPTADGVREQRNRRVVISIR